MEPSSTSCRTSPAAGTDHRNPVSEVTAPGPLLIDLSGPVLLAHEARWLTSPVVAGVIFFARNYQEPQQFRTLVGAIRQVAPGALLTVDQEGGRVQRFRQGLTRLPAVGRILRHFRGDLAAAVRASTDLATLMATELASLDVDLSFAPVMDIDSGRSTVIGDRAFASDGAAVEALALAWWRGLTRAGLAGVAKHFPGHGHVVADTHLDCATDERDLETLLATDLRPFVAAVEAGIEGIMPAHVSYPAVDVRPASRSPVWLRDILRQRLGFRGAIISDDLSMAGAAALPLPERLLDSLQAGCDLLLLCNDPAALQSAIVYLETLPVALTHDPNSVTRRVGLRRRPPEVNGTEGDTLLAAAGLAAEILSSADLA